MAEIFKKDMLRLWAETGDIVPPTDEKISTGWAVEVVPRQWWNWMQNRVDTNVAYILQKGVPEWDGTTEYIAGKSYVQHNNVIYKSIQTGTNQNPATATAYWQKALVESSASMEAIKAIVPSADTIAYFTGATTAASTSLTSFARTLLDDLTAASARTTLELNNVANVLQAPSTRVLTAGNGLTGGGDLSADRSFVLGTPSTLTTSTTNAVTATSHTHAVTFPVTSVAGKTGAVVLAKADIGLDQVDNTSDADKPVSTATAAALNLKFDKAGGSITGNTNLVVNSASEALRITQTGTGLALRVEDSANIDSTPFVVDANGNVGVKTAAPAVSLAVNATDAILVPVGSTANRPAGATGYFRFNTELTQFEGYNGTEWRAIGADDASTVDFQQAGAGAVVRSVQDKMREWVSVKDFGAVGDGVTDDQAAIQAAVDSGAKRIYFPAGTYYSSQSIKLKHTGSYFRRDTGQVFYGDGIGTILTRNNTTDTQGATDVQWHQRSFFSCYGSNNVFTDLQFYGCPIAIYFGQDPNEVELSHTSFNKMKNLLIQNCGTGFLSACAQGHYYNHYEAIHIAQCQIAVYFTVHSVWPTPLISNNNRNTFLNIRAARCQVGFWLSNGDTNSVYSFHCEGCGTTPTNNNYPVPSGLPGSLTTAAFIITADNNDFFGCFHESCDFYIYHDALNTQSFGNIFRINEDPAKQTFVRPFFHHFDRHTAWISNGTFARTSNSNDTAFPNAASGFAYVDGSRSNGGLDIGRQILLNAPTTGSIWAHPVQRCENVVALGAVAALGTASFTLWAEESVQTSSSAFFEVTVVGNSQTDNLVHANTFKVVVLRNNSRTPVRYYVYDQSVVRGTGPNAGDGSEPIVPSLTLGGVNTKDVILTFTMPNRTFESVSVRVVQVVTKA